MKTAWAVILTIVIMGGLAGGGYYYLNKRNQTDKKALQSQIDDLTVKLAADKTASSTATATDAANDTSGWKTYTNDQFGFSIKYPSNYSASNASSNTSNDGVFIYSSKDISQGPSVSVEAQAASGSLDVNVAGRTSDGTFTEAAKTTLDGIAAYEGVAHGESKYYGIIAIKGLNLVEIIFQVEDGSSLAASKAALTATQKQILATFQFTK